MTQQDPWIVTDPDQTLTEVLRRSGARESDVVIARLDCKSQVVTGLHRVRDGVSRGAAAVSDHERRWELSRECRAIAERLGSPREFSDGRWSAPTGVLITVVCRAGRLVDTACEFGWHLGWRYSNHDTDAFWGATFVVTIHGWLDVDQPHRFGVQPRLADPALRQLRVVP